MADTCGMADAHITEWLRCAAGAMEVCSPPEDYAVWVIALIARLARRGHFPSGYTREAFLQALSSTLNYRLEHGAWPQTWWGEALVALDDVPLEDLEPRPQAASDRFVNKEEIAERSPERREDREELPF